MSSRWRSHQNSRPTPYLVRVDENGRFMDEEARWTLGRFVECASAVAACKRRVDACLEEAYTPGMTAVALLDQYRAFGDDPFIVATDPGVPACPFSAWSYAEEKARLMTQSE
jgi:hypothetical protein